ncbi:MAG: polyribonucleotide nucleotidyltransferase [Patescibacteria group bacterium]
MNQKEYSIEWGGRTLTIGVDLLAQQANGSCTVRYGDTVVLCTATMGNIREGLDFFPLQVDYEEKFYAAGKIKCSRFIKREGRPSDEAVLSGRLIDRAIRPMFDERMRNEIAVVTTVLSHDLENDADILGLVGSSCALMLSNIPWNGPIAAARISKVGDQLVLNPTYQQIDEAKNEFIIAGANNKTLMLEAGMNQTSEDDAVKMVEFAHQNLQPAVDLIMKVVKAHGKEKLDVFTAKTEEEKVAMEERETLHKQAGEFLKGRVQTTLFAVPLKSKADRKNAGSNLKKELDAYLTEAQVGKDKRKVAAEVVDEFVEAGITRMILEEKRRADGRGLDEVRMLSADVGLLPRTHGSGLFMRGNTQVLSLVTLGAPGMAQTVDTMEYNVVRRFFHHYNFPSYAVSETKSNRGPGRREIGHGALAEKAILPIIPEKDKFPYTIRIVSEVLGSNGSSSMGSATASSLALMDAGVPIVAPVAGIAMGVASDEKNNRWQVITDLQDLEDGAGVMDFKVAGTRTGITAIQMDTKTLGIPMEVVKETFAKAKIARLQILDVVETAIAEPRAELSKWAPRIETMQINPEKIRDVIGPGGKVINEIIAQTGVEIDIEDDGSVFITSTTSEGMTKAKEMINNLTREVQVGEIFTGPVVRIMDFGAFVEILPGKDGLVHISEMAPYRVEKVSDMVKIGDVVKVKVYEIDSMGRINLSMKRAADDYKEGAGGARPSLRGNGPRNGGSGFGSSSPRRDSPRPFNKPASSPDVGRRTSDAGRPSGENDPFSITL